MTRDTAGTVGSRRDPHLKDFYHDMNQHGGAKYRRVAGRYVVERESMPSGWQITVWEAVQQGGRYILPDGGNRYVWDAVGREEFTNQRAQADSLERFGELDAKGGVRTFCQQNPYNGPRTSWAERGDK